MRRRWCFSSPSPMVWEREYSMAWPFCRGTCWRNRTDGKLAQIGTLSTPANQWAGLGPFRLKEYVAGQRLILERNPYYWKTDTKGHRLPYLDELVFLFVPSSVAQVLRFQSGEADVI